MIRRRGIQTAPPRAARREFRAVVCAACLALLPGLAPAQDGAWSVEHLMSVRAQWNELVGTPLRLEGRVSSHNKQQLRLQKCELPLRLESDQSLVLAAAKNVEATGEIRRDADAGQKLSFHVLRLKALPSDAEELRTRESGLKTGQVDDWYRLADWARNRGTFYGDESLLDAGRLLTAKAVGLESRGLRGDDVDGHFRLVTKARGLGLPVAVCQDLEHVAFRAWWTRAHDGGVVNVPDLEQLVRRLAEVWPESARPLAEWPAALAQTYQHDALTEFTRSDSDVRRQLQRVLAGLAIAKILSAKIDASGQNGAVVARDYRERLPERPDLALASLEKSWKYREDRVPTASRADVLALTEELRQAGQTGRSEAILRQWLDSREVPARIAGTPALLQLADDFLKLLKHESKAVELLTTAYRLEPESDDILKRFSALGYEERGGRWEKARPVTPEPPATEPEPPPATLQTGLKASDVIRLLGQPGTSATLVSGAGVDEVWSYGAGAGSRLVIVLRRRPSDAEATVQRIDNR